MAYTEIVTSGNTAQVSNEQWSDICHREYLGHAMMKLLIGTGENAVLRAREDLKKKSGDAITETYASEQTGGTIRGNARGEGNAGSMSFYAQRFVVDNIRTVQEMRDVPM